mmetsp:Transcript_5088/g.18376  ORF Transcript_5088/g.18376 Transcript_5088/m.18376 type:complete len:319 (-) Transcript_5088:124-1080(-)
MSVLGWPPPATLPHPASLRLAALEQDEWDAHVDHERSWVAERKVPGEHVGQSVDLPHPDAGGELPHVVLEASHVPDVAAGHQPVHDKVVHGPNDWNLRVHRIVKLPGDAVHRVVIWVEPPGVGVGVVQETQLHEVGEDARGGVVSLSLPPWQQASLLGEEVVAHDATDELSVRNRRVQGLTGAERHLPLLRGVALVVGAELLHRRVRVARNPGNLRIDALAVGPSLVRKREDAVVAIALEGALRLLQRGVERRGLAQGSRRGGRQGGRGAKRRKDGKGDDCGRRLHRSRRGKVGQLLVSLSRVGGSGRVCGEPMTCFL